MDAKDLNFLSSDGVRFFINSFQDAVDNENLIECKYHESSPIVTWKDGTDYLFLGCPSIVKLKQECTSYVTGKNINECIDLYKYHSNLAKRRRKENDQTSKSLRCVREKLIYESQ